MNIRLFLALCSLAALAGCSATTDKSGAPISNSAQSQSGAPAVAPAQFVDITRRAGITFKHNNGAFGLTLMPESVGSGVAFIDYDGDGYQDLFLVNSRDWTDAEVKAYEDGRWTPLELNAFRNRKGYRVGMPTRRRIPARRRRRTFSALYRNNRNGTFSDVTRQAGLDIELFGMGAAVGDYDNDGRPDLYVAGYGRNFLFHNEGGKFREVSGVAGVRDGGWSTSAAWVDYDKDGRLDLFVCHYVQWTPSTDIFQTSGGGLGPKSYAGPLPYRGDVGRLYHNQGGGKFVDVSRQAGILAQKPPGGGPQRQLIGKGLGIAVCDPNNDGWPDLLVTNDMERNFLFQNNHNGTFSEIAIETGIAFSNKGKPRAGMGVDVADVDHSGLESVVIGNFSSQMLGLYQLQFGENGGALFIDTAPDSEIGPASLKFLTFGCVFLDVDNDGWPDILAANGHVQEDVATINRGVSYAERPLLFHNEGGKKWREIGLQSGPGMQKHLVSRGLAVADIDLDGDVDVCFSNNAGAPLLLRNDGGNKNNAIRLELRGTKSNRSGIMAKVEAKVGGETLRRTVRSGSSYLSQSELPITLGLGQEPKATLITIRWLSGMVTSLPDVAAGQNIVVQEGRGIIRREPLQRESRERG